MRACDSLLCWSFCFKTGQYVILPTPGGRHLAEQWAEAAKGDYIARALHDQFGLYELQPQHWELCWTGAPQCKALREQARAANATKAIVRSFW